MCQDCNIGLFYTSLKAKFRFMGPRMNLMGLDQKIILLEESFDFHRNLENDFFPIKLYGEKLFFVFLIIDYFFKSEIFILIQHSVFRDKTDECINQTN